MKVDFDKVLLTLDGQQMQDKDSNKPLTLRQICVDSLLVVDKSVQLSGEEKITRYELALSIYQGKKEALSPEDAVLLRELIGKYYTTMVVGQVFPMLDDSA